MFTSTEDFQVVDLSHELSEDNPTWTGECGFHSKLDFDYPEVGCRVMSYELIAGVGTHMDAPLHFFPKGQDIATLSPRNFVARLCVIRVSSELNSDYLISASDVLEYEEKYGKIPLRSLVVGDTGWATYWNDQVRYRNLDADEKMHFPGFSVSAVELLLKREIVGIGIDTLSPDGGNTDFPVHHLLLNQGKYIIENLANLDLVPEKGAWMIALPSKIKQGAESPCRCIAII